MKAKPFNEYVIKQPVIFEKDGTKDILLIIDKLMKEVTNLLEIELMYQNNLPDNLKDMTKAEALCVKINNLKIK